MTHQATGTVVELTTRNFTSKAGKSLTKHGVRLDSGQAFELDGFKQSFSVGDKIHALGVALKYKVWTMTGGISPGAPAMPASAPSPGGAPAPTSGAPRSSGASSGGGGGYSSRDVGFPIPQDSYQMAIIRQNALTNAVSLVNEAYGVATGTAEDIAHEVAVRLNTALKLAYKMASFSSGQLDSIAAEEVAREVRGTLAKGAARDTE